MTKRILILIAFLSLSINAFANCELLYAENSLTPSDSPKYLTFDRVSDNPDIAPILEATRPLSEGAWARVPEFNLNSANGVTLEKVSGPFLRDLHELSGFGISRTPREFEESYSRKQRVRINFRGSNEDFPTPKVYYFDIELAHPTKINTHNDGTTSFEYKTSSTYGRYLPSSVRQIKFHVRNNKLAYIDIHFWMSIYRIKLHY